MENSKNYKLMHIFPHKLLNYNPMVYYSETDLIELGIDSIGVRKRILEGQVETHKRIWEKQSLHSVSFMDKLAGLRLDRIDL